MADAGEHDRKPDATRWKGHVVGGRYRIEGILGIGGMGTALLAHDERMNRKVVLKVPDPDLLREERFRKRFEREIRHLTTVEHPNVVKALDVGTHEGLPYAVLQYLAGGDLRGRLATLPRPMTPEEVLVWLPGIADALAYLHEHGFLHRDVKPENVLFDDSGHPHLADFGLAKALGVTATGVTTTGKIAGSPAYMAPEVLSEEDLDPAYDQYALGVCVYESLAGRFPVAGGTPAEVLLRRRREDPIPLSEAAPTVPPVVAAVVMRALSRRPEDRFESCLDFARAFSQAVRLGTVPVGHLGPAARSTRSHWRERPNRRRRAIVVGGGAVLLAGVVVAALLLGESERPWPKAAASPWRIDWPETGAWVKTRTVTVAGTGVAEPGARVLVNGVEATWEGTRFEATVPAPADGPLEILVDREAWGRKDRVARGRVEVDATRPVVVVTEPAASPAPVEGGAAWIRGRVEEENLLDLRVGDEVAEVSPDGTFAFEVAVKEEVHVVLEAEDRAGNRSKPIVVALRPVPRGSNALERAKAAAKSRDWKAAAASLAEARAAGASEGDVPAFLSDGVAAVAAIEGADSAAASRDWARVKALVATARGLGAKEDEVPQALRRGIAAFDLLARAGTAAERGEWEACEGLVAKAREAGATDADVPRALSDRLAVHALVVEAEEKAARGDVAGATALVAKALASGAREEDVPRALRERLASAAAAVRVAIDAPEEGHVSWAADVLVKGTVTDLLPTDRLTVNGVAARRGAGGYEATVRLLDREGPQTIAVKVEDATGVRAEERRTVVRRLEPSLGFLAGWAEAVGVEKDPDTHYPLRVRRTRDGAEMVFVPAGTFVMGAADDDRTAADDEKPRHEVRLSRPCYLDVGEVSAEAFERFTKATGYVTTIERLPAERRRDGQNRWVEVKRATWRDPLASGAETPPTDPVRLVSHEDAEAYAKWAGTGLSSPTEAQVERAFWLAREGRIPATGFRGFSGGGWFWCEDGYEADLYRQPATVDPVGRVREPERHSARGIGLVGGEAVRTTARRASASPSATIGIRLACVVR